MSAGLKTSWSIESSRTARSTRKKTGNTRGKESLFFKRGEKTFQLILKSVFSLKLLNNFFTLLNAWNETQ